MVRQIRDGFQAAVIVFDDVVPVAVCDVDVLRCIDAEARGLRQSTQRSQLGVAVIGIDVDRAGPVVRNVQQRAGGALTHLKWGLSVTGFSLSNETRPSYTCSIILSIRRFSTITIASDSFRPGTRSS